VLDSYPSNDVLYSTLWSTFQSNVHVQDTKYSTAMGKYQCKYIQRCHTITISIVIYQCVNALLQLEEDHHTKLRLWTTAILKARSSTPDALWQINTTAIPQQTSCLLPCKQLHRYWYAA